MKINSKIKSIVYTKINLMLNITTQEVAHAVAEYELLVPTLQLVTASFLLISNPVKINLISYIGLFAVFFRQNSYFT